MYGVPKGVYYCNQNRTQELSDRIYKRNIPSQQIQMSFDPRQVPTKYVRFPVLDCQLPNNVPIQNRGVYNQQQTFNPGQMAPYSGYATKVDDESKVQNMFEATQKWTPQSKFIPGSKSNMYVNKVVTSPENQVQMTNQLLFKEETFAPFNPNPCGLGNNMLYNHTRQQVKNLGNIHKGN